MGGDPFLVNEITGNRRTNSGTHTIQGSEQVRFVDLYHFGLFIRVREILVLDVTEMSRIARVEVDDLLDTGCFKLVNDSRGILIVYKQSNDTVSGMIDIYSCWNNCSDVLQFYTFCFVSLQSDKIELLTIPH